MDLLFSILFIVAITIAIWSGVNTNPNLVIFFLVALPILDYILRKKTENPLTNSIRIASWLNFILIMIFLVYSVTNLLNGSYDANLIMKEKLKISVMQEIDDFEIIDISYSKRGENIYDVSVYAQPKSKYPQHYRITYINAYENFKKKYGVQFKEPFADKLELFSSNPVPRFTVDLRTNGVTFAGVK